MYGASMPGAKNPRKGAGPDDVFEDMHHQRQDGQDEMDSERIGSTEQDQQNPHEQHTLLDRSASNASEDRLSRDNDALHGRDGEHAKLGSKQPSAREVADGQERSHRREHREQHPGERRPEAREKKPATRMRMPQLC